MKRGDLVTVALQGDFGKPRPAVIIQSNLFGGHTTVSMLPLTSTIVDAPLLRLTVEPSEGNGLQSASQVMIDKIFTARTEKIGARIGELTEMQMREVTRMLFLFLGND